MRIRLTENRLRDIIEECVNEYLTRLDLKRRGNFSKATHDDRFSTGDRVRINGTDIIGLISDFDVDVYGKEVADVEYVKDGGGMGTAMDVPVDNLELVKESVISEAADANFSKDDIGGVFHRLGSSGTESSDIFNGIKEYCIQHLGQPVGQGSSRIVFQIDDNRVLKLALNNKGVAQNKAEAHCYQQSDSNNDLFPRIFDMSPDGLWIDCEFVLPAEEQDFEECTDYDWQEVVELVDGMSRYSYLHDESYIKKQIDYLKDHDPFIAELYQYVAVDNAPHGDVERLCNWGMTRRNGVTRMVVLDSGLTWKILEDFYWTKGNTW